MSLVEMFMNVRDGDRRVLSCITLCIGFSMFPLRITLRLRYSSYSPFGIKLRIKVLVIATFISS